MGKHKFTTGWCDHCGSETKALPKDENGKFIPCPEGPEEGYNNAIINFSPRSPSSQPPVIFIGQEMSDQPTEKDVASMPSPLAGVPPPSQLILAKRYVSAFSELSNSEKSTIRALLDQELVAPAAVLGGRVEELRDVIVDNSSKLNGRNSFLTDPELNKLINHLFPKVEEVDVRVWKELFQFELSTAEVEVSSEGMMEVIRGGHLLVKKLPNIFISRYGNIPEKIYVRDCYKTLYESAAEARILQDKCPNVAGATLFTGVPGIGKSLFLVYFIYRFLSDERFTDKTFALEFARGEYVYFKSTGAHGEFSCSIVAGSQSLNKQFLLLCDISDAVEPLMRARWTYIFSSPAPARYKEIIKNIPNQEYTLPTWSQLELMFVSGDIDKWYDDFVLFGGVPHYIFSNKDLKMFNRDPRILIMNALEEKGGALAESFFKFGFGIADWFQSYMLVHINPPVSANGEFEYCGKKVYTFASDAIFLWLAEKHSTQMLAGAVGMFNVGAASESYGAVSAGKLFKKVCLWLKPMDGIRFNATALTAGIMDAVFEVPSQREVLLQDWKKTARLVPDVLYVPRISNLESGDSFYLVLVPTGGYLLVVLQVTTGKSHPVKVNGLHDILLAYMHDVKENVVSKALVFVLPAHGELDREQALLTKKEQEMGSAHVPIVVRGFNQYIYRHVI